jgi:WD40 repeat protein
MKGNIMAWLRRWWGWGVFVALLVGVGAGLHAVLPPQPRLRVEGRGIGISDDGGKLYTLDTTENGGPIGPLAEWDTRTGQVLRLIGHHQKYTPGEFSPDHSRWICFDKEQTIARIFDLRDGSEKVVDLKSAAEAVTDKVLPINSVRLSHIIQNRWACFSIEGGGKWVVRKHPPADLVGGVYLACIVDLASGKVVYRAQTGGLLGVAEDPPVLLHLGPAGDVCAFNFADMTRRSLPESSVFLGMSADGSVFATQERDLAGDTFTVQVWDSATLARKHLLPGLAAQRRVIFSPDKQRLAMMTGGDADALIWDLATEKKRFALPCRAGRLRDFVFSPDGCWLAGCDPNHSSVLVIFNLETGEEQFRIELDNLAGSLRFLDRRHIFIERGGLPFFIGRRKGEQMIPILVQLPHDRSDGKGCRILSHARRSDDFHASDDGRFALRTGIAQSVEDRWLDQVRKRLAEWIPALAVDEQHEWSLVDLRTGRESRSIASHDWVSGFFSKDGSTLVMRHRGESATSVWDVPLPRPWRWIVGVPTALGAGLLGVRFAWRRWRAKPA